MQGVGRAREVSAGLVLAFALALPASSLLPGCSDDPLCSEAKALSSKKTAAALSQALASDSIRLLIVGDTGEGNLAQSLVGRAMNDKCAALGGCDAVIMPGDNFYQDGVHAIEDLQFFSKFEEPYQLPHLEVGRDGETPLPFYVVLGNHDVRSDWRPQVQYSALPVGDGAGFRKSARWTMPARWYDVRLRRSDGSEPGFVHLFAFDTTAFEDASQAPDMAARITASDATWKISFAHHPRYTSGAHYFDNPGLGEAGMYALQETIFCGTDLFIAGHDHNTEYIDKGRHAACPDTHFLISGAGSKVRSSRAPRDARSLFFDDQTEAFAYLEITEQSMHVEIVDMCGNTRFQRDISR